jgi:hypothetical protein
VCSPSLSWKELKYRNRSYYFVIVAIVVDVILAPFIHAPLQPLSVSLVGRLPEFVAGAHDMNLHLSNNPRHNLPDLTFGIDGYMGEIPFGISSYHYAVPREARLPVISLCGSVRAAVLYNYAFTEAVWEGGQHLLNAPFVFGAGADGGLNSTYSQATQPQGGQSNEL